jgi:cytochrome c
MVRTLTRTAFVAIVSALIASPALADGNAAKGKDIFPRCAMCHSDAKGAPNKIGPNLWGVVGRKAGTEPDFNYSAALKGSGITWTPDKLEEWVQGPGKMVPGTRMMFAGVSKSQAEDVVAYLETLK